MSRLVAKTVSPALPLLVLLAACGGGHGGGTGVTGPITPTVTVTPAATSVTTAQTVSVAVTVSGAAAGMVTLTSGAFSSGALALSGGSASFTVPAGVLPVGSDVLNVAYAPASAATSQASGTAAITVSAAAASSVTASTTPVAVNGFPAQAQALGSNVLVSVTNNASGGQTGIAVYTAATPGQLTYKCTQAAAQPGPDGTSSALGLTTFPNGLDLALAVGDPGADFLNAVTAASNCSSGQVVTPQGTFSSTMQVGTFAVAVTPDGKYAFVANEYGVVAQDSTGANIPGNVGVVALSYDSSGHVSGATLVGQFSTGGQDIANVTISPDGTRLYVTSEIAQPGVTVSGTANATLAHGGCIQYAGTKPQTYGLLSVIDVAKAEAAPNASAIIATVAAGCSPVRVVETSDNQVIWVAARGDNAVLAFSTHMLETSPDSALLGSGNTGGVAPVGLQLFHNQQFLAVANSNRFSNPDGKGAPTVDGNFTIMSATPVSPTVLQTLPAALFPRNVSVNADDSTLYLTDYTSQRLQVITTSVP